MITKKYALDLMDKNIKLILAALLLLCLADMPYSYYELIRLIALVGFSILTYQVYLQKRQVEIVIYCTLALLFQPFFKLALGRSLWSIIDVITAAWLLISIWIDPFLAKTKPKLKNTLSAQERSTKQKNKF